MTELEARREALLRRCEEQRLEIAYRLEQVRPAAQLTAWRSRSRGSRLGSAARHPLAWVAGLASVVMMLRRRRLLGGLTWVTGLVALASRATSLLRIFLKARAVYTGIRSTSAKSGRRDL